MPQPCPNPHRNPPGASPVRIAACAVLALVSALPLAPLHAASLPQPVSSSSRFT